MASSDDMMQAGSVKHILQSTFQDLDGYKEPAAPFPAHGAGQQEVDGNTNEGSTGSGMDGSTPAASVVGQLPEEGKEEEQEGAAAPAEAAADAKVEQRAQAAAPGDAAAMTSTPSAEEREEDPLTDADRAELERIQAQLASRRGAADAVAARLRASQEEAKRKDREHYEFTRKFHLVQNEEVVMPRVVERVAEVEASAEAAQTAGATADPGGTAPGTGRRVTFDGQDRGAASGGGGGGGQPRMVSAKRMADTMEREAQVRAGNIRAGQRAPDARRSESTPHYLAATSAASNRATATLATKTALGLGTHRPVTPDGGVGSLLGDGEGDALEAELEAQLLGSKAAGGRRRAPERKVDERAADAAVVGRMRHKQKYLRNPRWHPGGKGQQAPETLRAKIRRQRGAAAAGEKLDVTLAAATGARPGDTLRMPQTRARRPPRPDALAASKQLSLRPEGDETSDEDEPDDDGFAPLPAGDGFAPLPAGGGSKEVVFQEVGDGSAGGREIVPLVHSKAWKGGSAEDPDALRLAKAHTLHGVRRGVVIDAGKSLECGPFVCQPATVEMTHYRPGEELTMKVSIKNGDSVLRSVRVLPPTSDQWSVDPPVYVGSRRRAANGGAPEDAAMSALAPGMGVSVLVRFRPTSYAPFQDDIVILTEQGKFGLPCVARLPAPRLTLPPALEVGLCLAHDCVVATIPFHNAGPGLAVARLFRREDWPPPGGQGPEALSLLDPAGPDACIATALSLFGTLEGVVSPADTAEGVVASVQEAVLGPAPGADSLRSGAFTVSPVELSMPPGASARLVVAFSPPRPGPYEERFVLAFRGGESMPITIRGDCSALRVALSAMDGRKLAAGPISFLPDGGSPAGAAPRAVVDMPLSPPLARTTARLGATASGGQSRRGGRGDGYELADLSATAKSLLAVARPDLSAQLARSQSATGSLVSGGGRGGGPAGSPGLSVATDPAPGGPGGGVRFSAAAVPTPGSATSAAVVRSRGPSAARRARSGVLVSNPTPLLHFENAWAGREAAPRTITVRNDTPTPLPFAWTLVDKRTGVEYRPSPVRPPPAGLNTAKAAAATAAATAAAAVSPTGSAPPSPARPGAGGSVAGSAAASAGPGQYTLSELALEPREATGALPSSLPPGPFSINPAIGILPASSTTSFTLRFHPALPAEDLRFEARMRVATVPVDPRRVAPLQPMLDHAGEKGLQATLKFTGQLGAEAGAGKGKGGGSRGGAEGSVAPAAAEVIDPEARRERRRRGLLRRIQRVGGSIQREAGPEGEDMVVFLPKGWSWTGPLGVEGAQRRAAAAAAGRPRLPEDGELVEVPEVVPDPAVPRATVEVLRLAVAGASPMPAPSLRPGVVVLPQPVVEGQTTVGHVTLHNPSGLPVRFRFSRPLMRRRLPTLASGEGVAVSSAEPAQILALGDEFGPIVVDDSRGGSGPVALHSQHALAPALAGLSLTNDPLKGPRGGPPRPAWEVVSPDTGLTASEEAAAALAEEESNKPRVGFAFKPDGTAEGTYQAPPPSGRRAASPAASSRPGTAGSDLSSPLNSKPSTAQRPTRGAEVPSRAPAAAADPDRIAANPGWSGASGPAVELPHDPMTDLEATPLQALSVSSRQVLTFEPASGVLPAGGSAKVAVVFAPPKAAEYAMECDVHFETATSIVPEEAPLPPHVLRVLATVDVPRARFLQPSIDFGLMRTAGTKSQSVLVENLSNCPCPFALSQVLSQQAVAVGSQLQGGGKLLARAASSPALALEEEQQDVGANASTHLALPGLGCELSFTPSCGVLGPRETAQVVVTCTAGNRATRLRELVRLDCGELQALHDEEDIPPTGQQYVGRGDASFLQALGDVQRPVVQLGPAALPLGMTFVGVPVRRTLQLANICNLPVNFAFDTRTMKRMLAAMATTQRGPDGGLTGPGLMSVLEAGLVTERSDADGGESVVSGFTAATGTSFAESALGSVGSVASTVGPGHRRRFDVPFDLELNPPRGCLGEKETTEIAVRVVPKRPSVFDTMVGCDVSGIGQPLGFRLSAVVRPLTVAFVIQDPDGNPMPLVSRPTAAGPGDGATPSLQAGTQGSGAGPGGDAAGVAASDEPAASDAAAGADAGVGVEPDASAAADSGNDAEAEGAEDDAEAGAGAEADAQVDSNELELRPLSPVAAGRTPASPSLGNLVAGRSLVSSPSSMSFSSSVAALRQFCSDQRRVAADEEAAFEAGLARAESGLGADETLAAVRASFEEARAAGASIGAFPPVDFGDAFPTFARRTYSMKVYNLSGIPTDFRVSVKRYPAHEGSVARGPAGLVEEGYDPLEHEPEPPEQPLAPAVTIGRIDAVEGEGSGVLVTEAGVAAAGDGAASGGGGVGAPAACATSASAAGRRTTKRKGFLFADRKPRPGSNAKGRGALTSRERMANKAAQAIRKQAAAAAAGNGKEEEGAAAAATAGVRTTRKGKVRWLPSTRMMERRDKFRSEQGRERVRAAAEKEVMMEQLSLQNGVAFQVWPPECHLDPFSCVTVRVSCVADMPGEYRDTLVLAMDGYKVMEAPVRVGVVGSPLTISPTTAGLRLDAWPRVLSFGDLPRGAGPATKTITIANSSPLDAHVRFRLLLDVNPDRPAAATAVDVDVRGAGAGLAVGVSRHPPRLPVADLPFVMLQETGVVPARGSASFRVRAHPRLCTTAEAQADIRCGWGRAIEELGDPSRRAAVLVDALFVGAGEDPPEDLAEALVSKATPDDEERVEGLPEPAVRRGAGGNGDNGDQEAAAAELQASTAAMPHIRRSALQLRLHCTPIKPYLSVDKRAGIRGVPTFKLGVWATKPASHASYRKEVTLTNELAVASTFHVEVSEGPFLLERQRTAAPAKPGLASDMQAETFRTMRAQGKKLVTLPPGANIILTVAFDPRAAQRLEAVAARTGRSLAATAGGGGADEEGLSAAEQAHKRLAEPVWSRLCKEYPGKLLLTFANGDTQVVGLRAQVLRPTVVAAPAEHTFGVVRIGEFAPHTVSVANPTPVDAQWTLTHVPWQQPRRRVHVDMGALGIDHAGGLEGLRAEQALRGDEEEDEEYQDQLEMDAPGGAQRGPPLDEPAAFGFSAHRGLLRGPTAPLDAARGAALRDVGESEHAPDMQPFALGVRFKPTKAARYRCRFRASVENGDGFEFVLRGTGSSREEEGVQAIVLDGRGAGDASHLSKGARAQRVVQRVRKPKQRTLRASAAVATKRAAGGSGSAATRR